MAEKETVTGGDDRTTGLAAVPDPLGDEPGSPATALGTLAHRLLELIPLDLDAAQRIDASGPMGKNLKFKILKYPPFRLPRVAFRNLGNLHFEECGARWGFNDEGVSHGMALADLDNVRRTTV